MINFKYFVRIESLYLILRVIDNLSAFYQGKDDPSEDKNLSNISDTLRMNLKVINLYRFYFLNFAILSLNNLFFSISLRLGM